MSDLIRPLLEIIVRRRWSTTTLVVVVTAVLVAGLGRLTIVIDPDATLPQTQPSVVATNLADRLFGNKFAIMIGISPQRGDVLQPAVLSAVREITKSLTNDPGVVRSTMASLTATKTKDIRGSEDGLIVGPLLGNVRSTAQSKAEFEAAIARNPVYGGLLISKDHRTTLIVADFKKDPGGFKAIAARVEAIVAPYRSSDLRIDVAGQPILLGLTEIYSDRMFVLFPLALLVIGLIHFEAFRSWQGLVLPLITGLVATVWALGIMGWTDTPLDAFNASTPILILAVGAGHAVQILKRYYEEYGRALMQTPTDTFAANRNAIVTSLATTSPVMIAAGLTAAVSFASLMVFRIGTIRTFGLFTAVGILSAMALELTLIPALRAILSPPGRRELAREQDARIWDCIAKTLAGLVIRRPRAILVGAGVVLAIAIGGAALVKVDNSLRAYFRPSNEVRLQDQRLNEQLAGDNVLSVIVRGGADDAIKSPAVLRAMEATQRFLEREPMVGKTVSLADFIRQIDRAMNDDPDLSRPLPDRQDLIAQYLLLYSISGSPGDFDSYVDSGYRNAIVTAYLREEGSVYLEDLSRRLRSFVDATFPPGVEVLIGGNVMSPVALNEVIVSSKLLNMLQISLAVFLMCSLVFRSFIGGALVLVPLVFAVAINFGLMGFAGIPLQVATATVSAMAVGIGADYAIYLLYRLREEARSAPPEIAVERMFQSAGKAVMFVATAIAGGYAVIMLSWGFMIHVWLGLLISVAMLVSATAALTILPALLMIFRPKFLFAVTHAAAAPVAGLLLLLLFAQPAAAQAPTLSAVEVMQRNFLATKAVDTTAEATFTLISADGQQRVRRTQGLTKLREDGVSNMRLTRFLSPPDIRGTATLTIENAAADDDIWIYLPALKRVRRLLASNTKDSFVGTDFSYGDIIGFKVEEWRHTILRTENVDGVPCFVVDSVPLTPLALENSGYSRRHQWIRVDNFVTIRGEYFDQAGQLWKTFAASDLRIADPARGRWQPMKLDSRDVQAKHETIIQFDSFRSNVGLTTDQFSARVLDREP